MNVIALIAIIQSTTTTLEDSWAISYKDKNSLTVLSHLLDI